MDEINEELEKYYNFAQQQNQQQQMSHQQHMSQQHMNAQQHMNQQQRMNHEQHISQQQHINQQQPMGQQQIHHLGQRIGDSQHGHSGHDSFDQQDLLDLVSNEFYSSAQFTNNEDSSSRILLNSQYKHQSDDQTLFLDQINTSTLPQQINRDSLSSSIPTYIPSSQPFPLNDSLTIDQMQQRRNSELAFNHNSNQQHNNNNNSNNNNNINNNNHNYIFQEHQQQLILNEANSMLSPFEQSQNSLASNNSHSNFQTKPRQERDVFSELITLATKNNPTMRQHNVNNWQNHDNHNSTQGAPHSFSSTEFPSNVQLQIENQHVLQQNQNNKKRSYPDPSSITTAHFAQVKAASEANTSSSSTPKKPDQPKTEKTYNERIYKLSIAQQPSRARMCGFGDKDRRPISPPPIVQLVVTTKDGQVINPETFDVSFLVVMCDSCQQIDPIDGDPEFSMYENPLSQVISYPTTTTDNGETNSNTAIRMRNLVGSSVSSATKLYDLQGNFGIFFIFQDVSLRTEGCFRLKFSLIDVGSPYSNCVNTTSVSHVLEVLYTEPFMVYTAKKFPGVVQSTPLSKCFASQGIKIPIRKEKTASTKKPQTANQNSENAEKSDDEED